MAGSGGLAPYKHWAGGDEAPGWVGGCPLNVAELCQTPRRVGQGNGCHDFFRGLGPDNASAHLLPLPRKLCPSEVWVPFS